MNTGMKRCNTCTEENLYDAKYCIICGNAFPSYTDSTRRLGDVVLGDKIAGDVIYGNKVEYGSNKPFHSSPFLLASGVPLNMRTSPGRLRITSEQYWEFLANGQLTFDLVTGEVLLYGYPVDIDW